MGGRYCAINSPLGSRWGQKSLDLRSRDFCPHLEPRGELIAQYRPPMSFRYRNIFSVTGHLCREFTGHRCLGIPSTKGQWCVALMFSLICVWINSWVNNREAGDLGRYCGHYDVIVMIAWSLLYGTAQQIRTWFIIYSTTFKAPISWNGNNSLTFCSNLVIIKIPKVGML